VIISTANITTIEGCQNLLKAAIELGPVGGIFNFAAVLQDGIFTNQTEEMFARSLAPKATATRLLHEASIELCKNLKHFVVFSSISCGRGSAGQTNYGMANSIMEEIVVMRHQMGLPGKAIQWGEFLCQIVAKNMINKFQKFITGPIADVGMLSDAASGDNFSVSLQSLPSVLESLDTLLLHPDPIVASTVIPDKEVSSNEKLGLVDMLMKLLNIEDKKTISMNSTFSQLGIDSLAGVEMQQLIEREYGVTLSAKEIRTLSLAELEMRVSAGGEVVKEEASGKDRSVVQVFFDYYGVEDLLFSITSTEMFVKLNEVESSDNRKVLFIPGIGGVTYKKLEKIAASIDLPMYVIQYFLIDHSPEFDDLCEKMAPLIVDFFKGSPDFTLVCYSFGTLIGLKIAKVLEENGLSGKVVEIDGSPQVIYRYYLRIFPDRSDKKIHDMLLGAMKRYFRVGKDNEKDSSNSMVQLLKLTFPQYDGNDYRSYMNALINRFKMQFNINEIEFDVLERTKITLIRASENGLTGIHKDFGLTKYSKEPVGIETIEGDHNSIMDKIELINLIKAVVVG
jgi:fatty acid synthase